MGMFDTFLVPVQGHLVEVQTKRFDCVLGEYRYGDVVAGAPGGIRVYFDQVRLDEDYQPIYGQPGGKPWTLFVVLVEGVYTDSHAEPGDENIDVAAHIEALKRHWSDSHRVLTRWVEFLQSRQVECRRLHTTLNDALALIESARRLRAGEDLSRRFVPLLTEVQRLQQGEDVLDVLESVLKAQPANGLDTGGARPDLLEEHRL